MQKGPAQSCRCQNSPWGLSRRDPFFLFYFDRFLPAFLQLGCFPLEIIQARTRRVRRANLDRREGMIRSGRSPTASAQDINGTSRSCCRNGHPTKNSIASLAIFSWYSERSTFCMPLHRSKGCCTAEAATHSELCFAQLAHHLSSKSACPTFLYMMHVIFGPVISGI